VNLYGTPDELNAYLAGGKLKAGGSGSVAVAGPVTVTGGASGSITVSALSNTASTRTQPTLNLPLTIGSAYTNGKIVLASGALGTGTDTTTQTRTVVLSLLDAGGVASTTATLTATDLGSSGLSAYVGAFTTAVTSGDTSATASLALEGTESALSAYLANAAGKLKFNGANGQSYTLRVAVRQMNGTAVVSETMKLATVTAIQPAAEGASDTALAPAIASLPASLQITANEPSALAFTGATLDDGDANTNAALTLKLSVLAGTLTATSAMTTAGMGVQCWPMGAFTCRSYGTGTSPARRAQSPN
jgi:hypothetical protein